MPLVTNFDWLVLFFVYPMEFLVCFYEKCAKQKISICTMAQPQSAEAHTYLIIAIFIIQIPWPELEWNPTLPDLEILKIIESDIMPSFIIIIVRKLIIRKCHISSVKICENDLITKAGWLLWYCSGNHTSLILHLNTVLLSRTGWQQTLTCHHK